MCYGEGTAEPDSAHIAGFNRFVQIREFRTIVKNRHRVTAQRSGWLVISIPIFLLAISIQPAFLGHVVSGADVRSGGIPTGKQALAQGPSAAIAGRSISLGQGPQYGAVDPSSGRIYVTDIYSNTVSIFSSKTSEPLATDPVGTEPWGVAVDPKTNDAFVADRGGDNVTVIHGLTVTRSIRVGPDPTWTLYNPISNLIYVTDESSNLSAISPSTYAVTARIPLGSNCFSNQMTFDPTNGFVYITLSYCNKVIVVNAAMTTVVQTIKVGNYPVGIVYDAANTDVYVVDYGGVGGEDCSAVTQIADLTVTHTFYVDSDCADFNIGYYPLEGLLVTTGVSVEIDSGSGVLASINTFEDPQTPFYDQSNGAMYVPDQEENTIDDIRGPPLSPVAKLYTTEPAGLATTPTGTEYVARYSSGTVAVIGEATNKVVHVLTVGAGAYGVAYDSGTNAIYVTDSLAAEVSVIAVASNKVIATIPVGLQPEGISYDPVDHTVDVANFASNSLMFINDHSYLVTAATLVGHGPVGVFASHGTVYVSNSYSGSVSVVSGASHKVVNTFSVDLQPQQLAVDQGNLFVTSTGTGDLDVVNVSNGQVVTTIYLGGNPTGVVVDGGNLFVADPENGGVYEISASTFFNSITYYAAPHPYFLAVAPDSGFLFATDFLYNDEIARFSLT
ncbi:MAG: YncE family protein [Thermoplasmata archaeon]